MELSRIYNTVIFAFVANKLDTLNTIKIDKRFEI